MNVGPVNVGSPDVSSAIRAALLTPEPRAKIFATRRLARDWRRGRLATSFGAPMPERPAWPGWLELKPAREMPKRGRGGSERNRIALWHSLAHIEFVAIDLALDMAGRFGQQMGEQFTADFIRVAAEEALHFALIERKLNALGSRYGALPAHDGLWSAASDTSHDVAARLAIVPMVLEARGLDVTPALIDRVRGQGDAAGARILERILADEIRHVRTGAKHFEALCRSHGKNPENQWKYLVGEHFRGTLKPPFNASAREAAGLSLEYYGAVA